MTLDERIAKLKTQHIQMGKAAMSHPQYVAYEEIKANWDEALAIIDKQAEMIFALRSIIENERSDLEYLAEYGGFDAGPMERTLSVAEWARRRLEKL